MCSSSPESNLLKQPDSLLIFSSPGGWTMLFLSFSSHELHAAISTGNRLCFFWFCCWIFCSCCCSCSCMLPSHFRCQGHRRRHYSGTSYFNSLVAMDLLSSHFLTPRKATVDICNTIQKTAKLRAFLIKKEEATHDNKRRKTCHAEKKATHFQCFQGDVGFFLTFSWIFNERLRYVNDGCCYSKLRHL